MDTGTSSVSGYSEAWDGTNVSISMTVTGTTSGFFENDDQQKLEEKKAAATVASGVEAALQVLAKGCWDPNQWNADVREGNRYFANVQNADNYTKGWNDAYSGHNKGAKESSSIIDLGIHPASDTERALLPPNIESGNYSLVLKYYPGEGMAVTANTSSMEHLYGAMGYFSRLDPNVNVKFAQQLLQHAPECKK